MQWEITFSGEPVVLTIRAWGSARLEGFKGYFLEALAHPSFRPNLPVLLDFRQLNAAALSANDLKELVAFQSQARSGVQNSPIAVLVERPVDFGVARMWEVISEGLFKYKHVFYDADAANAWLARHAPSTSDLPAYSSMSDASRPPS
jgi:hypothetical protein